MADSSGFVGVFDSGIGGVSVLKRLVQVLPHEDFNYFGDSAHNPYGAKTKEEILGYSRAIAHEMLDCGAKALVIACNTATSVAAQTLRQELLDVPIVGIEPAVRPAALSYPGGRVLVMATPVTLALEKYQHLAAEYSADVTIYSEPCIGLAHRIERGNLDEPDVLALIDELVGSYRGLVDAVVLGCTHYPFVAAQIRQVLGDVPLYDGAEGCAQRLAKLLDERQLQSKQKNPGKLSFASSLPGEEILQRYRSFFDCSFNTN